MTPSSTVMKVSGENDAIANPSTDMKAERGTGCSFATAVK